MPAGIAWPTVAVASVASASAGTDQADPIQTVEARDDLARRLEAEFDLELLEEAERRVRRRVAPHTWEAYRLTAIEGLSGAEAAARLGMKVAAVFVSRSHVTRHLQQRSPGPGRPSRGVTTGVIRATASRERIDDGSLRLPRPRPARAPAGRAARRRAAGGRRGPCGGMPDLSAGAGRARRRPRRGAGAGRPSPAPGRGGPEAGFLRSFKDRGPPREPDRRDAEPVCSDPIDTGRTGSW